MSRNNEFSEIESAASRIRDLVASKAEAEVQIADCLRELDSAKRMLDSACAEPITDANKQYLKAATKAWRLSIKAFKSSIVAFQSDVAEYESEIDAILKRTPEARRDH